MNTRTKWIRTPEGITTAIMSSFLLLMGFPVAAYLLGRPVGFLQDLGFLSGPRGTTLAWFLGVVVAIAYIAYTMKRVPMVALRWREVSPLKALSLLLAVVAATVEEAFFRRLSMDAVAGAGGNAILQVITSALGFGIAHAVWGLFGRNLHVALAAATSTAALGGGLAVVYLVGGRSLAPCIVSHFLLTAAIEPALMLAAVSGNMKGDARRLNAV